MQQQEDVKETVTRKFSHKVLETMVKFTAALGDTRSRDAVVYVRAIKDGPIELKMLDMAKIELVVVTVQRPEDDIESFATTFDLDELERLVKATAKDSNVDVTLTEPEQGKKEYFYRKSHLYCDGVWTEMDGDISYADMDEVVLPDYAVDHEIDVNNEDIKKTFHMFTDAGAVAIRVVAGGNHNLVVENAREDYKEMKGVVLWETNHDEDWRGQMYDWDRLKRTLKVFYQVGGRAQKTSWKLSTNGPLCIYWSMYEIMVKTYFAPRVRDWP
jgi:hypothetical protein